jgi:glucose-6-phosphate isomerase
MDGAPVREGEGDRGDDVQVSGMGGSDVGLAARFFALREYPCQIRPIRD